MSDTAVCIPNIGRNERKKRVMFGALAGAATLGFAAWLMSADAGPWVRAALFLPAWAAALGFFQAREKT